jgi:mono/diheme cytochrome c family protein
LLIIAITLVAIACAKQNSRVTTNSRPATSASPTAAVDQLALAKEHFQKNCQGCHGEQGNGGPVKHEGKTLKVPSLREGHATQHSDQDLVKQILNGGDGMPAFKDKLSTKDAADLVALIRRDFQGK